MNNEITKEWYIDHFHNFMKNSDFYRTNNIPGLSKQKFKKLTYFLRLLEYPKFDHLRNDEGVAFESALLELGTPQQIRTYINCVVLNSDCGKGRIEALKLQKERIRPIFLIEAWIDKKGDYLRYYDSLMNDRDVNASTARQGLRNELHERYNIKYNELSKFETMFETLYGRPATRDETRNYLWDILINGSPQAAPEEEDLMV